MILDEAYRILGLIPLDDFIDQRASWNLKNGHPRYQGIGATTWMLVSAALQMGSENLLVVDPRSQGDSTWRKLRDILCRLGFGSSWEHQSGKLRLKSRNHMAFFSNTRYGQTFWGTVFHDNDWKEKAAQKADLGPFGRIREIRMRGASWDEPDRDQYLAFGVNGTFLFELTWNGALKLLQTDENIQTVGWER